MKTLATFILTLALGAALSSPRPALAQSGGSELSALSALPVALSIAAPVGLLTSGAKLSVAAIETASGATVWVLENASDGARASVTLSGQVAGGVSLAVGTAVAIVAVGSGWILSAAGQAVAFIPNEIGKALLHNERITR